MSFLDSYEPVEDRLREFWSDHPHGRIVTQLVHHGSVPGEVLVFLAECYRDQPDPRPAATGWAHQRLLENPPQGRNGPNTSAPEWTSPWEVAETSAIGRALANLGYAPKGKRPSREEVSKADNASKYQGTPTSPGEPRTQPTQGVPPPSSSVPAEGQSPEPSGDEAHGDTGAPTHGESTSPETVQESGLNQPINGEVPTTPITGEVAVTPAPGAVTELANPDQVKDPTAPLGAEGAKALAGALGGQKAALDFARLTWPNKASLRDLTRYEAALLLKHAEKRVSA